MDSSFPPQLIDYSLQFRQSLGGRLFPPHEQLRALLPEKALNLLILAMLLISSCAHQLQ
jgi:hypothetical protein